MSTAPLFPGPLESVERPARDSESTYAYLNCASGARYDRIRELVERWYHNYPSDHREDLRSRFQSSDTFPRLSSVFFELYLHELLIQLGYRLTIHPDLSPATSKRPEFLVESASGERFILEAVTATALSQEEQARQARINSLYDTINSKLDSPDCFLSIEIIESSTSSLAGKGIIDFLREQLASVDVDTLAEAFSQQDFDALPEWIYEENGWSIRCSPIPKSPEARGKEGHRPLGLFPQPARAIEPRNPIIKAIKKKASRYNVLGIPYVIAVNAIGMFVDHIAIMEALFGKEVITYSTLNGELVGQPQLQRKPDGTFFYEGSPINTRVSGVLMVNDLGPWSVASSTCVLYENPWARFPYTGRLHEVSRYDRNGEEMTLHPGTHPREIFGLSVQWPLEEEAG